MNKLMIIGLCMWGPIWVYSYTTSAESFLNNPDNLPITLVLVALMIIGLVLWFKGLIDKLGKMK